MTSVPSEVLARWLSQAPQGGRVLEIGASGGEVAVWLAEQGFTVDAVETDPVYSERLQAVAADPRIHYHPVDILDFTLKPNGYVLIHAGAILHFIEPSLLPSLADELVTALKSRGILIASAFTIDDPEVQVQRSRGSVEFHPGAFRLGPEGEIIHYFQSGELRALFGPLDILEYEETRWSDPESVGGYRAGATLVAQKPETVPDRGR